MSRSGSADAAAWILLLSALGCGDPLVGGLYPGEPLFQISGQVQVESDQEQPSKGVQVSALWGPEDELDWQTTIDLSTTFPDRFLMTLYAPPPSGVDDTPLGPGLSVGALVLYVNDDGEVGFSRGSDTLVGGSGDQLLIYVSEDAAEADTGVAWSSTPGYHTGRLVRGDCLTVASAIEETDPLDVKLYLSDAAAAPLAGCGPDSEGP